MNFETSNPSKRDKEIEKYINYLGYYPNLFEQERQVEIERHIYNFIDEIYVKTDSVYLEDGFYGDAIKKENDKFRIKYVSGEGRDADKFAALHELGHVLLTPSKDNNCRYQNAMPSQGPCKYDTYLHEFYGLGIDEGTINMLANISILKADCPQFLEDYIKKGICCFKVSSYRPLEEIARLLTIASLPCNENPTSYFATIIKNQKIADKESSTYLNSCLNNDFSFEKEFNQLFNDNYACYNLYKDIDKIHEQIMKKTEIDKKLLKNIFLKINSYYTRKVHQEIISGKLDIDKQEILQTNFNNYIEKVFNNLNIERGKKTNEV